jgi:hypothetical protein
LRRFLFTIASSTPKFDTAPFFKLQSTFHARLRSQPPATKQKQHASLPTRKALSTHP